MTDCAGDATLLTIDRGNTTLDCRLRGPRADRRARLDGDDAKALSAFLDGPPRPDAVAALSVVAGGLDRVQSACVKAGVDLAVAGVDLPCPLTVDYAAPAMLGVDRWVGAVAALERFGAALVVDCGSAVTVDGVSAAGRFIGGVIAPGMAALAAGLAARAPALPGADLDRDAVLPTRDSIAAVSAGVQFGFVAMVDGLIERVLSACGGSPTIVLTGGDAAVLERESKHAFIVVPELLHDGLRSLWTAHRSSQS